MEDTYRARICPICGGVVKCDLKATDSVDDVGSFNLAFTARCLGCGLEVSGNSSKVFKLFLNRKPSKIVTDAFFDKDDKWVYQTATYRGN